MAEPLWPSVPAGTLGLLLIYGYAARVFRTQYEARRSSGNAGTGAAFHRRESHPATRKRQHRAQGLFVPGLGLLLSVFVLLSFMGASCYTDKREIDAAPFRKMYFETIAESARNYENLSDDELNVIFEYHHGAGQVRHAMDILKENHWNVFRE